MFAVPVLQEIKFDQPDQIDSYFMEYEELWIVFTSLFAGGILGWEDFLKQDPKMIGVSHSFVGPWSPKLIHMVMIAQFWQQKPTTRIVMTGPHVFTIYNLQCSHFTSLTVHNTKFSWLKL